MVEKTWGALFHDAQKHRVLTKHCTHPAMRTCSWKYNYMEYHSSTIFTFCWNRTVYRTYKHAVSVTNIGVGTMMSINPNLSGSNIKLPLNRRHSWVVTSTIKQLVWLLSQWLRVTDVRLKPNDVEWNPSVSHFLFSETDVSLLNFITVIIIFYFYSVKRLCDMFIA